MEHIIFIYFIMSESKDIKEESITEEANKEDAIPILFLPKDLINHMDSLNESNIEIKKDINNINNINNNCINSSKSSNDEDSPIKMTENKKLNLDNNIFGNDKIQTNNQINNFPMNLEDIQNNSINLAKLFQQQNMNSFYGCNQQLNIINNANIPNFDEQYNKNMLYFNLNESAPFYENNNKFCLNNININNNYINNNSINYNNNYINNNNNYISNNNNVQNQISFLNSCFTMNGRAGWICTSCKNFNYQSKYIYFIK